MPPANEVFGPLPAGYVAAPVLPGQAQAPLRLCALFRQTADPVAGHWVMVRQTMDAQVYLGGLIDFAGRLHRYVELWVQNIDGIRATPGGRRDLLTNRSLDQRWARQHEALVQADAASVFTTGWEARHPPPLLYDPAASRLAAFPQGEGGEWRLCEDDAALSAAGLPPFGASLDRYLFQPKLASVSSFIAVTVGAPLNDRVLPSQKVLASTNVVPFNPAAGLLMVRDFCPLRYEELLDLLRTGTWEGVRHGTAVLPPPKELGARDRAASENGDAGLLLLSRSGQAGRMIETLYLRLGALSAAVAAVRDVVRHTGRPILNLTDDSFRVAIGPAAGGLPLMWTARPCLTDPGDAVPLSVEGTDAQYFLRGGGPKGSVYRPEAGEGGEGRGSFRIRQVLPETRGVVIEGTFKPNERLVAARNDLLRVRLGVAAGRVDLYTRLQPEMALAGGEWRLRSVPQSLAEPIASQLRAAQGVAFSAAEYEHIPLLSTPCDVYALAVLAVRTLLLKQDTPLAVTLDEMYSLARQVAQEHDESARLPTRIAAIFWKDPRWGQALGPQVLAAESVPPEQAAALLPAEIWWDLLAMIVRAFPGVGRDSTCVDYGDAPANALHRAFEPMLRDLDALLPKVGGLITGDARYNREVQGVIRRFITAPAGSAPSPASQRPPAR